MSWRTATLLVAASVFAWAGPALAQGKKASEQSAGDAAGGDAKPDQKKHDEGDVVFDNTGMAKKKRIEKDQAVAEQYGNDTPFANTAPNPVALREQRWKPGIGGGYRLGWAFPAGDADQLERFSDAVKGMIFLWGDFGYWPIPQLFVGLDLSGGYVLPKCDNASCWGLDVRGGPEVLGRFLPFENVSPMAGLGFGYEFLMLKASNEIESISNKFRGFELLNLQAGIDVRSEGAFYGIFVFYSFGKFDHASVDFEDKTGGPLSFSQSGSIDNTATHHWLGIGARGTLE